MKKLFISQPMNGKTNEEILHERNTAIKCAKAILKDEVEIIDSFFENAPVNANPVWFLSQSIKFLSSADIAYFAKGWDKARGCKIEHEICVQYGIPNIKAPEVTKED